MKIITIFLITVLLLGTINIQAEQSTKTIYVDDVPGSGLDNPPEDFTSIQEAIDIANDGDTIYIYNGTYYENIVIFKPITLQGENKDSVIIDGAQVFSVLYISSSNVTINNLTITNSSKSTHSSGIKISGIIYYPDTHTTPVTNINISDCIITKNQEAIRVDTVRNIRVYNCNIYKNNYSITIINSNDTMISSCNIYENECSLHIAHCENNSILNCTIQKINRGAIHWSYSYNITINNCHITEANALFFDDCNNITISNCIISNNTYSGINLGQSSDIVIHNNIIESNGWTGLRIYLCKNVVISGNTIQAHEGVYSCGAGISISDNKDSHVIRNNNIISNHPNGIYITSELTNSNKIIQNNFIGNTCAVKFFGYHSKCSTKHIFRNNYWDQKTIPFGPKIIFGQFYFNHHIYNSINIDWFPARNPFPTNGYQL